MSLIRVLQSELRSLSEEARKKHPHIKDAADRGIRQLRSIQEQVDDDNVNQSKAVRTNEEILKPFLLACESKVTKLIVTSLSSMQQLLLHSAVPIVCHICVIPLQFYSFWVVFVFANTIKAYNNNHFHSAHIGRTKYHCRDSGTSLWRKQ